MFLKDLIERNWLSRPIDENQEVYWIDENNP